MPLPKIIPALADLTQDIAGPVPVELLQAWAAGGQDLSAAAALLGRFQIQGTVVSTDTSGLSRLTQEADLLDVLSLISEPKEIIYALGREIGGRAVGTWVADNTEMFYPESVEPDTVVDAMAEVQHRIGERLKLRIGMCVHSGTFYEIGQGLYGGEAERVEYLAEKCAGPGEILLTERVARQLGENTSGVLTPKTFQHEDFTEQALLLPPGRRMAELQERDRAYPQPYPEDFYKLLPHFHDPAERAQMKQRVYDRWLRERVVVFLARHQEPGSRTMADMLDDLVINALMDTVVREAAQSSEHIASSGAGLAILTFANPQDAVDFARSAQAQLAANQLPVAAGIDAGPVLLFENARGPSGIAGNAINVASKLAEDIGATGSIHVTEQAASQLGFHEARDTFVTKISGMELRGIVIR
ncbi:MAG: hypothetical protein ABL995_11975 [Bryobacteraceae bacterium]